MANLNPPHPPGDYPVVVVGSGPGGLQTAYFLSKLGIRHAHLSADDAPGGMFRRFPIFQRLISWTKLHSPEAAGTREFERYDWNSLIADEPDNRALVGGYMDGTSQFPARTEMERGMAAFAERTGSAVRYGCRWEATRAEGGGFVLETSDGEYRCRVAIFALGMTQPWKPDVEGIDAVPHYVDTKRPEDYADRSVFVIGKRNSGFEIADGLLPWTRRIILGSPRPTGIFVLSRSIAARYMQPYEDHVLGGGNLVVDAAIERVVRTPSGYRVHAAGTTRPGDLVFDVDDVIAATGFKVPLGDLPSLGVATFNDDRLPAQTPFWESVSVPGIYFAGSTTQGAVGLKKYGIPSSSNSVHGFRYNARLVARHIAERHFGVETPSSALSPSEVVDHLLGAATRSPELWNQRSYLAAAVELDGSRGIRDAGVVPLAHFVDSAGPDAVAVAIEADAAGDIHPAVYVRTAGRIDEHLMNGSPLHDYRSPDHHAQLQAIVDPLLD